MKNKLLSLIVLVLFTGCSLKTPVDTHQSHDVIYLGCKDDGRTCFTKSIHAHLHRHLNTEIFCDSGLEGKVRMYVDFLVDKYGDVQVLRVRANYVAFKDELRRVFEKLPQMLPRVQNGEVLDTPFTVPVSFICQ